MSNTQPTKEPSQHIKDLLKRAEEGTQKALRDYFGHPKTETIYQRRRLLTIKEWKQKKRELEIADFKAFSAKLKLPPMSE
jgi:hypothetical protein